MDLLDRLLGHDLWTTQQLLILCGDLSDEQLDRDLDIAHRTVRRTFEHIIRNVEIWSDLMSDRPGRDAEGNSVNQLLDRLERAAGDLAHLARDVSRRDGWDEKWIDALDGRERTYGGSIAHVITHSMHHRAQLLYMLRLLGVPNLPEGDVLSWEHQAGNGT